MQMAESAVRMRDFQTTRKRKWEYACSVRNCTTNRVCQYINKLFSNGSTLNWLLFFFKLYYARYNQLVLYTMHKIKKISRRIGVPENISLILGQL